MRDVLGYGVLRPNGTGVDTIAFAGLGHGIITGIEVLAILEMLGEVIGAGRKLAVKAEETLLLWREGLDVHLVLLEGVHDCSGRRMADGRNEMS